LLQTIQREPDFDMTSLGDDYAELLTRVDTQG
jgi:hypothetical protein